MSGSTRSTAGGGRFGQVGEVAVSVLVGGGEDYPGSEVVESGRWSWSVSWRWRRWSITQRVGR